MPPPSDKKRISAAEAAQKALAESIRKLQGESADEIIAFMETRLEISGGRIVQSAGNIAKMQGFYGLLRRLGMRLKNAVLELLLDGAIVLSDENQKYFESDNLKPGDFKDIARKRALLRMGYNVANGELIPGGYLDGVFSGTPYAGRVGAIVNRAIARGYDLNRFRREFRRVFVGPPGKGMLEHHFNRMAFDMFQRMDRNVHLLYAEKLGLNDAIYSGTIMSESRPFCRERVGKIFSKAEIEAWADLEFQGKPDIGYDPFTDCGGYNCRHHLSFVSPQTAYQLLKNQTIKKLKEKSKKQDL